MSTNSVMSIGKEADGVWRATFGSFDEEEAPMLADSIDQLFGQCKIPQLELTTWRPDIEVVVKCLYDKGFVYLESKDGHGNVVQRAIYKKRIVEQDF